MTDTGAQRTVLGALAVLVVVRTVQRVRAGDSLVSPREFFGAMGTGVVLLIIAEPMPEVAAMLAVTAAVTGTVSAGPSLFRNAPEAGPRRPVLSGSPDSLARRSGIPATP